MPYEIDELENTLTQLRRASYYLSGKNEWIIDVTLGLSDELTNWKDSAIHPSYFVSKLKSLGEKIDWATSNFLVSDEIKGCVSQRRNTLHKYPNSDYHIWLDTDIIFDERTLTYFESGMERLKESSPYIILTPEFVRIWDNTWDILVNENFINEPYEYNQTNDPYKDSGVKGTVELIETYNTRSPQSPYKFAGGWFTCLSTELLKLTDVPESYGHYGYEDTYIMVASNILKTLKGYPVKQFKTKNLVVCENYKYRDSKYISKFLSPIDRREEYKKVADDNFKPELLKLQEKTFQKNSL